MRASSFSLKTLVNLQAWPLAAEPFLREVVMGTNDVTSAGLWDLPRRPKPFISTPLVDKNLSMASLAAEDEFPEAAAAAPPCPLVGSAKVTSNSEELLLVVRVVAEVVEAPP